MGGTDRFTAVISGIVALEGTLGALLWRISKWSSRIADRMDRLESRMRALETGRRR